VTSLERVARPVGWAEPPSAVRFFQDAWTVAQGELRKLAHDPTELLTRAVQPVLWLLVFGQVLAQARAIPTGNLGYMDFLAPGVLAQSALFSAIFFGIAVIWERDLGVLHKYLVSPASRLALAPYGVCVCSPCPGRNSSVIASSLFWARGSSPWLRIQSPNAPQATGSW